MCVCVRACVRARKCRWERFVVHIHACADTHVTYITDKTDIRQKHLPHCTCMAMLMNECRECVNARGV